MKKVFISSTTKQEDFFLGSKSVYYAMYVVNQSTQNEMAYLNVIVKCIEEEELENLNPENIVNQDVPGIFVKSYNENINLNLKDIPTPENLPTTVTTSDLNEFLESYYLDYFLNSNIVYGFTQWNELN